MKYSGEIYTAGFFVKESFVDQRITALSNHSLYHVHAEWSVFNCFWLEDDTTAQLIQPIKMIDFHLTSDLIQCKFCKHIRINVEGEEEEDEDEE